MKKIASLLTLVVFFSFIISCSKKSNNIKENYSSKFYVSEKYFQRNQGFDWLAIKVTKISNEQIFLSIRSRDDKKKPTCTFDGVFTKIEPNKYQKLVFGKKIFCQISKNKIKIFAEDQKGRDVLSYYCSGGGNFIGEYSLLNKKLALTKEKPAIFLEQLSLQGITYDIFVIENEKQQIKVIVSNLKNGPAENTFPLIGKIQGIEIEDLDCDGAPELLIFQKENKKNAATQVYGLSPNKKISISELYFPPLQRLPQSKDGFNGNDEFAIVEIYLCQHFPLYNKNKKKTGKMRQITYKLVNGEACKIFKVNNIFDYDK